MSDGRTFLRVVLANAYISARFPSNMCDNSPDCFFVDDAEEHYSHAGASLHHHLDEFSSFSEVIAQYQTGGFPHKASPRAQHQAVAVAFCKGKAYDFCTRTPRESHGDILTENESLMFPRKRNSWDIYRVANIDFSSFFHAFSEYDGRNAITRLFSFKSYLKAELNE